MKKLCGLYKKLGRDGFLEAEKQPSNHAYDTVETALDDTKSNWFYGDHALTEAGKMIRDCNSGRLRGGDSINLRSPVMTKMKIFT